MKPRCVVPLPRHPISPAILDAQRALLQHRRARAAELETLRREHAALVKTLAFRTGRPV